MTDAQKVSHPSPHSSGPGQRVAKRQDQDEESQGGCGIGRSCPKEQAQGHNEEFDLPG